VPDQLYQFLIILLLCAWVIPVLLIWVRYDRLPHAKNIFIALLILPSLLADNFIHATGVGADLSFLIGIFDFSPMLISVFLYFAIHKLTMEDTPSNLPVEFIPVVLLLIGQYPLMSMVSDTKVMMNDAAPNGQLALYWPWYAYHCLLNLGLLVYALRIEHQLNDYQQHLSDQVVDVTYYKMSGWAKLFAVLITLSFSALMLIMAIGFGLISFSQWLLTLDVLYYLVFFVLIMVLLEKRRYSPSPLNYKKMKKNSYTQEQMQHAVQVSGEAIISGKLYKMVGLRLRHVADRANIDPQLLAVSSRALLNRNFRAYIYHYRLEYAKNVLMRSDAKVSAVAKRLGFTSEKFLSDMFIKYVEVMGKQPADTEDEEKHLLG
jgi:AraC-like DNA-binding protein